MRPGFRPVPPRSAERIRADLEAAEIPYEEESGRVVDVHALRATFVSNLVRPGASPKLVQTLARLSTPQLTLGARRFSAS